LFIYWNGVRSAYINKSHDLRLLDNVCWGIEGIRSDAYPISGRYGNLKTQRLQNVQNGIGDQSIPTAVNYQIRQMALDLHYFNTANGTDGQTAANQFHGYGAPQRLNCDYISRGRLKTICNVTAAENRLRAAITATAPNLVAPVEIFPDANRFARIFCDGVNSARFSRDL